MSNDSSSAAGELPARQKWYRRPQKAGLGHPALVIFNVLLIFIISQVFAAFVVQTAMNLANGHSASIGNSAAAEFVYVLLAEGLAAGFVIYIIKSRKLSFDVIGLGRRPGKSDVYRGLGGFLAFYVILIAAAAILTQFFPDLDNGSQDVGFNSLHTRPDILLAFMALVFLPPIGEEILVRGYLYAGLRQRLKFVPALLITSLFFGAAHLQTGTDGSTLWAAGLNTFVLSAVLVYLRESTGALYAGMLVHMFNNLIAFAFHFHL
jgi:membrane protease YdiL (CAAX protease family)